MTHSQTRSFATAYRLRWPALMAAVGVTAVFLGLLLIDLIVRFRVGGRVVTLLESHLGVFRVGIERGLQGTLGLYFSEDGYRAARTFALLGYFATQVVFLYPRRNWTQHLLSRKRLPAPVIVCAALPAALLSVSAVATVLEMVGVWSGLQRDSVAPLFPASPTILRFSSQAYVALPIVLVAWSAWVYLFWRPIGKTDAHMQRIIIVYYTFVVAGLELLVAGLYQSYGFGFEFNPPYWIAGSYTAMMLSLACLLWTMFPGLVLLFVSQQHYRRRFGLCLRCGYDLRGTVDAHRHTCPECGAAITM